MYIRVIYIDYVGPSEKVTALLLRARAIPLPSIPTQGSIALISMQCFVTI